MRQRWYLGLIGAAAVAAGVCAWLFTDVQLRWIASGGSYIAVGLYAWYRRPESRTGLLLVLTGWGFWSSLAQATRVPIFWTVGSALEASWLPALTYLMLTFPTGRVTSAAQRYAIWASLTPVLVSGIAGSTVYDPRDFGCGDCQPHLNLLLIHSYPDYVRSWGGLVVLLVLLAELAVLVVVAARGASASVRARVIRVVCGLPLVTSSLLVAFPHQTFSVLRQVPVLVLLLVGITVLIVQRYWRASPPAQRVLSPMLLPASGFLLSVAAQQAIGLLLEYWTVFEPTPYLFQLLTTIAVASSILLPVTFLLGLARARHRQAIVSDLVLELGDLPPADQLERALSRTLRDPSLSVGRWDATSRGFVGADGRLLTLPEEGSGRTTTLLERGGTPLAAIVHDEALLDNEGLLSSVAAATRLVVENEGLQAEVRAQLDDVRASRARIVEAADAERRRLERDLHDGAQQRIVSVCLDLKLVAAGLSAKADPELHNSITAAANGLQVALSELRELARGIHPAVLTEEGLGPALRTLAERARIPTTVTCEVPLRLRPTIEATAYFVASEALANVAKYAHASGAAIDVRLEDDELVLEVTDDGQGGADPSLGSGLRGLVDRVGAADGDLQLRSEPGNGTSLRITIPCGAEALAATPAGR